MRVLVLSFILNLIIWFVGVLKRLYEKIKFIIKRAILGRDKLSFFDVYL